MPKANIEPAQSPIGHAPSDTMAFDVSSRLTSPLDGLGQTKYTYAVLGNGMRTFHEDAPLASDDVMVTKRHGPRSALVITQPIGQFLVTNSWDGAGRWSVVGGTPGTFTYNYAVVSASGLLASIGLPGGLNVAVAVKLCPMGFLSAECRDGARVRQLAGALENSDSGLDVWKAVASHRTPCAGAPNLATVAK
ncbi:MAG: hypothetical protein GX456_16510 [Verrucomicrobia bacterium]|nr:hypothetical protein [Verrucomicrobiota bacterium]